jgi:hypothetical protein
MRLLFLALCLSVCVVLNGKNVFASTEASVNPAAKTFSPRLQNQLDLCLQRIEQYYLDDPQFEFDIHLHCQALAQLLSQHDFSAYLQQPLEHSLSIDQLMDLRSIAATINSANTASAGYPFDFRSLPTLLSNTLTLEKEPDLSWQKRFMNWLAEFFEKSEPKQPDWLKNWLTNLSIPAWVVKAFYTGMVIMLAILLLAIVIVEVRAAGVSNWFKRRSQSLRLSDTLSRESHDAMLTWDAILQLPAKDKILTSYKKLLHVLASNNLIPKDTSLTNHELQDCLEKSLGGEQPVFRQLIRGVETTLYGDKALDQDFLDKVSRSTAQFAGSLAARQHSR